MTSRHHTSDRVIREPSQTGQDGDHLLEVVEIGSLHSSTSSEGKTRRPLSTADSALSQECSYWTQWMSDFAQDYKVVPHTHTEYVAPHICIVTLQPLGSILS